MTMTTAGFALFLHITFVIAGLSMAAVMHAGLLLLRSARDVSSARPWPRVISLLEPSLPVTALLVVLTGAWLLHLSGGEFDWQQGWVTTALIGVIVVEALGAVVGPRSAALKKAIRMAPDGPVDSELQRRILDPALWCLLHGGTSVFLAIVFVMVVKPTGPWSAGIVAVVGVIGAASGLPFTRGRPAPAAVARTSGVIDVTEPSESWTRQRS